MLANCLFLGYFSLSSYFSLSCFFKKVKKKLNFKFQIQLIHKSLMHSFFFLLGFSSIKEKKISLPYLSPSIPLRHTIPLLHRATTATPPFPIDDFFVRFVSSLLSPPFLLQIFFLLNSYFDFWDDPLSLLMRVLGSSMFF